MTGKTTQEDIDDAIALIATGHALGLKIPVPAGMTLWGVSTGFLGEDDSDDDGQNSVKLYSTEDDAYRGLANQILHNYVSGDALAPWNNHINGSGKLDSDEEIANAEKWLKEHDAVDVVEDYYGRYSGEWKNICEVVVASPQPMNYRVTLNEANASL